MTNTLWRGVRGHGAATRLMAATLAIVFMVAVAGPGLALDGAGSEPTSTPEPVGIAPAPVEEPAPEAPVAPEAPLELPTEAGVQQPPGAESTVSDGVIAASGFMAPLAVGDDVLPAGPFSRDFSQLANETGSIQWINGDLNRNNSTYTEGMSVPQRLILTGMTTPDAGHYVTFGYDFTKSGKYAYDFMASWSQASESAGDIAGQTWSDSWQWLGIDPAVKAALDNYYVDVTIPSNGVAAARETAYEGALGYGDRTVRVYSDQPLSNVYVTASTTPSGSTAGDSSLEFTVHWDGPADGVMIVYASHIANGVDPYLPHTGIGWGAGMGASGISGSPYHNYTVESSEFGGAMDNSLKASSVDAMSGITGMKFDDVDGDGAYPPEIGETGLAGWQIWADLNDDGDYDAGIDAITTTAADGRYGLYFFLPDQTRASSVDLYEVQQPENGYVQTYPVSGHHTVSIEPSQEVTGKDFGNYLDLKPLVEITKTANPTSVPETGAAVTFTFVLQNTGPIDWTLTSLDDTEFGDLTDEAEAAWEDEGKVLPVKVPVGGSWSFTYSATLAADDLVAHHNDATVVVSDADGDTDDDSDDADVTFTDVAPAIRVTKTADPTHIPEGGDYVTFTVLVENIGVEDVTLTSLSDTVFGDLDGKGTITLPQTILVGGSYSGSFTVALSSDTLTPHYNVVTATAVDDDGTPATDDDDATVTFDDTPPEITVTKTANPTSVPETGGNVTFTITVENTGDEAVTLTGAIDTVFGAIPVAEFDKTVLAVGETATYSFTEWLASDSLTAHNNVATVTAEDNDGTEDSDSDDADVTFTDVAPLIDVTKSVDDDSIPETGQSVTYTFRITNTGAEDVTVTSITDDKFGNLLPTAKAQNGGADIVIPATNPDSYYEFTYTTSLASDSLTSHVNRVDVTAVDDESTPATDYDVETVRFTDVAPAIRVTKTADPTHIPEGGDYVTFTVLVENIGVEDVTLTSLSDTVFGDLDGKGTITLPQTILVGGSYSGSFTVALSSDTLTPHYNVVTATAVDDDGTPATDDDDATVTFDDTPPEITVTKTANPTSVPETGGNVTFTITVENTGDEAVTLTGAIDTVFGAIPVAEFDKTVLAVGETATYSFTEWLASDSLTAHNNVATVTAEDNDGTEDSDSDDADVTFTDVAPVVSVVKTADPEWMIMPGGTFDYTATVTNDSAEAVQVISVVDDIFGTIYEWDTEDPEIWLAPTESRDFEFSVVHDEPGVYPNTVTVVVEDNDGTRDSDEDSAEVVVTDPKIEITKTSDAPVQGVQVGTPLLVTYTYLVTNTGDVPLYNVLVTDDKLGEIGGLEVLGVGESKTFTKSTTITDGVTNIAEVTAIDEHENEVSDTDDEVIEGFLPFTEVDLAITKAANKDTADPGELVTYKLTYWNTGDKPATDFTIVDDFDQRYVTIENAAGGVVADGKITWTIPGPLVAADGKKTITYTVRVAGTMPDGATNVDNVVIITVPDDADESNDRATERVVVSEPFLPFTGGDYLLLLVAALAAAGTGVSLRMKAARTEHRF